MTHHRMPPTRSRSLRDSHSRPGLGIAPAILAGLILATTAGAAPPAIEVENARVGFGPAPALGRSGDIFKIGTWTPIYIQLKGGPEAFSGSMDVLVTDDDGMPSAYRQSVAVGPRESKRFTSYVRPGGRDSEFTIRLIDADGRRVSEVSQERAMPIAPIAILPEERWFLTLGRPMGVDQLPGLTDRGRGPQGSVVSELVVVPADAQSGMMPGRWYGFDGVQAIILDTNDPAAMKALDAPRGQAIVEWVKRGGHLVLSVGAAWQAVKDSVLGPILPALPVGQEQVSSLDALDTFAGSIKPITPAGSPPAMVTRLEGLEERGGKIESIMANLPLVVRGAHGFGRVTLIALDVDQKLFGDWDGRGLFWAKALELRRERSEENGSGARPTGSRFFQTGVTDLSSQLRVALEQFPSVKLVPFGWVAFFIFLYILLIGPGDYFFLRKVLGRMELTWVTFPIIVITVSALAYVAAYRLKGSELLINKVDLIDLDQTSGLIRGRSFATVFSPQNRDYGFGFLPVLPSAEVRVPAVVEPGSGPEQARPPAGMEVLTTWFSVPENQFGAMGGSTRRFSFVGSGYTYQPAGAVERLEGVRIPIWSTKSITGSWFGPGNSAIEAELRPVGTDRLAGTVTNRRDYPLEDAILAFGKQVYLLGTMAPGQTVRVELSGDRFLANHLRERQKNYLPEQPWKRAARLNRSDLAVAIMFHESEASRSNERALGNSALGNLDLTGQLALDRPMLVARIDRPGAQLVLGNSSGTPRVEQTSVLRVILPLGKPSGGASPAASGSRPTNAGR